MKRPQAVPAGKPVREDHLGASTYLEKTWHLIATEDFAAAEAAATHALTLAPSDPGARTLRGWAVMRQGRHDEAFELLNGVLNEDPMQALARACLGYVCMKKGFLREAQEHMSVAARQMRDPKAALYGCFFMGLLYGQLRDVVEAERFFARTLSLAPNFIEAYYELGRVFHAAGQPGEAERVWKTGSDANRFSQWGKRCGEALRLAREGEPPPSYS